MRNTFPKTISLLIFLLFFIPHAQPCVVVSGQTVAFTLSAGAKAAWNNTITALRQHPALYANGISFSVCQCPNGAIIFNTKGLKNNTQSKISLFSLDGRKVFAAATHARTSCEFNKKLAPGIYLACFDVDGKILKTIRFVARGQL